jgi:hypothetical protein
VASRRATRGNSAAIRPDDLISLDEWGVDWNQSTVATVPGRG